MLGIEIDIERFIDESQPGWVECSLTEALGIEHKYREKVPIVTAESLDSDSSYPRKGVVACVIVERCILDGREIVTVESESIWGVESIAGESKFKVLSENVINI